MTFLCNVQWRIKEPLHPFNLHALALSCFLFGAGIVNIKQSILMKLSFVHKTINNFLEREQLSSSKEDISEISCIARERIYRRRWLHTRNSGSAARSHRLTFPHIWKVLTKVQHQLQCHIPISGVIFPVLHKTIWTSNQNAVVLKMP